jgi:hypothetical protein
VSPVTCLAGGCCRSLLPCPKPSLASCLHPSTPASYCLTGAALSGALEDADRVPGSLVSTHPMPGGPPCSPTTAGVY